MSESIIMKRLLSKTTTIDDFNFDNMIAPPLLSLVTIDDINYMHKLATSIRYSSNINYKYKEIDNIMKARGFALLSRGTNRVVYRYLENQSIVLKIAIDDVGIKDNPREFENQKYLKPFVCKIFEVSPCGTVAVVERVNNIKNREEFLSIAGDIYDLLCNWILGKYVLDDIGANKFLNYGVREGFGPVLLDYPYMYELDGNKLYCQQNINGTICDGTIDYDDTFDNLYCTKCGRIYLAKELEKAIKNKTILQKGNGKVDLNMKIITRRGKNVIKKTDTTKETRKITKRERIYNNIPDLNDMIKVKVTGRSKSNSIDLSDIESRIEKNEDDIKLNVKTRKNSVYGKFNNSEEKNNNELIDQFNTHTDFIPNKEEENIESEKTYEDIVDDKEEDVEIAEEDSLEKENNDSENINETQEDIEEDESSYAKIPVGAAPPKNQKRSKRFDPDFYK